MRKIRLTEKQLSYIAKCLNEVDGADTPALDATSQVKTDGLVNGVKKVVNQAKSSGIDGARVTIDSGALNEKFNKKLCIGSKKQIMESRRKKLLEKTIVKTNKKDLFKN